jgi:hypothetical protein
MVVVVVVGEVDGFCWMVVMVMVVDELRINEVRLVNGAAKLCQITGVFIGNAHLCSQEAVRAVQQLVAYGW